MEKTENRSMQIKGTFKANIQLLWDIWTKPEHLKNWWGPKGFSATIHKMDLQAGGEWRLTLHGPDGKDYANRSIFKEIIPLEKIVFEHFNPHFLTIVLFEAEGEETLINWTMLFDTPEMRETIVKVHKAEEGQKENMERLGEYLFELSTD